MKTINKGYYATFEELQEFFMKHQNAIEALNVMQNDNPHIYGEWLLIYTITTEDN